MPPKISSIWHPYGLREDPYFQRPVSPELKSQQPPTLFVGREDELRRLVRQVGSSGDSRVVVEGDAGVGKTSFVNRLKADVAAAGLLTHTMPIRVEPWMQTRDFVAEVLRTLLRIRTAHYTPSNKPGATKPRVPRGAKVLWQEVEKAVEGRDTISGAGGSLTIPPGYSIGGEASFRRDQPDIAPGIYFQLMNDALTQFCDETESRVLLHVNNLETLSTEERSRAAVLFLNLRDYFLIPGAHWVFVGTTGVDRDIVRPWDQVGGIFASPVTLAPLSASDVGKMLVLRYKHLQMGFRLTEPVRDRDAQQLYEHYHGDLRNFLSLLSEAASLELGLSGIEPLSAERILRVMSPRYRAKLYHSMGRAQFERTEQIFAASGDENKEFRATEVSKWCKLSVSAAADLLERLVTHRIVTISHTDGRSIYYRPTGIAAIAFLTLRETGTT